MAAMKLLSVNRCLPRTLEINGKPVATGIYKEPADGPVRVHKLGMEGDGQADLTVHGGEHQAVYAYPSEHYACWESELSLPPCPPGTFGENFTVSGLLETGVHVGDHFRIGGIVLEATSARIPCFKLGHKLDRPNMLKAFLHSGRSGFYLRVVEEGTVRAGDPVEVISRDPLAVTIRALLGMHRLGEGGREQLERALAVDALAPLVRRELEARLAKL
jgi:MOSC domain-containing protein YiiM